MSQLVSLGVAVAFAVLFRKSLKSKPSVFYVLAALVACLGVYFTYSPMAAEAVRAFAFAVQKGHVGFGLLVVVMFVGVFRDGSPIRKALQPVRGELSIIASILMMAHVVPYTISYAGMVSTIGSLRPTVIASLTIAVVLIALLAVLAITSLQSVKQAMKADSWKRVQWLAYLFFALIFFHLLGYLMVPAFAGAMRSTVALAYYLVVYVVYALARIRRALVDKKGRRP